MSIFAKTLEALSTVPGLIALAIFGFLFFAAIGIYERRHR
jgi:hypothetical protein